MTFETATSVTHKLWDRSTMHHELDALIHPEVFNLEDQLRSARADT